MQPSRRFSSIDSMRAVAATSVLVFHIISHLAKQPDASRFVILFQGFISNWFDMGLFGVVLFFLISGFVIPSSLSQSSGLRSFWISRLFRLYPPFWLSLVFVLTVEFFVGEKSFGFWQAVSNISMVPQIFGYKPVSGVYWTLFIEMGFYVACSVLYVVGGLEKIRINLALIFILTLAVVVPYVVEAIAGFKMPYKFFAFHLSILFCGALVRKVFQSGNWLLLGGVFLWMLLCVTVVSGLYFSVPAGFGEQGCAASILAFVAASALFLVSVFTGWPDGQLMVKVGGSSYSLYLLHWPVFSLVLLFAPDFLKNDFFIIVAGVVLSFFVASISYHQVEARFMRIGKRIASLSVKHG